MESTLEQLFKRTNNPESQSDLEQASGQLQELLQSPQIIPPIINLFSSTSDSLVRKSCLLYLNQVIKSVWMDLPEELKILLKQFIFSFFTTDAKCPFNNMICTLLENIYDNDDNGKMEIMALLLSNWASHPQICSQALEAISEHFDWETNDNSEAIIPQILAPVSQFLISPQHDIQVSGLKIFSELFGTIPNYEEIGKFIEIVNQIMLNSLNYTDSEYSTIWNSVNLIMSSFSSLNKEEIGEAFNILRQSALLISSNGEITSTRRILPLTALVNTMAFDTSQEMIEILLHQCIDVMAQSIVENQTLPLDMLDLISTIFSAQIPRDQIYTLISEKVNSAISSGSYPHATAGLLVLRVLFVDAPECAHHDAEKIASLIQTALSSQDPFLVQAAASVIEIFDDTFKSINIYSPDLLKSLFPYTIHESVEVRQHCLRAALVLSEKLDSEIPNLFDAIWTLFKQSSPDDITAFFTLIACSIKCTADFNDDNVEVLMQLIDEVLQKQDPNSIASSFSIVHALISFDSDLTEVLLPKILPSIGPCISFNNSDILRMTVCFLSDCIVFFHEPAKSIVEPFIQKLVEFIINEPANECVTDSIRAAALITCSNYITYANQDGEAEKCATLLPVVLNAINSFLDLNSIELQTSATQSIPAISDLLTNEQCSDFFKKLIELIETNTELTVIQDAISCISCLVSKTGNEEIVGMSSKLLTDIITGKEVAFLNETPLIQIETSLSLFENICKLISALISVNSPISQQICEFLIEWIKRDSELDKIHAIGSLSDAILYDAVQPEMCSAIVQRVVELIPNANDPGLQENIIYLFNACIIKHSELIEPIMAVMPAFVSWWQIGKEKESGYTEVINNLSSLFLGLAIFVPTFPENILFEVFDAFPSVESSTNSNMCRNIISFVQNRSEMSQELHRKLGLACARLLMIDKLKLTDMEIDDELLMEIRNILIVILQKMPALQKEIMDLCGKSKVKIRRIQNLLPA